jgi:hypothetical protein
MGNKKRKRVVCKRVFRGKRVSPVVTSKISTPGPENDISTPRPTCVRPGPSTDKSTSVTDGASCSKLGLGPANAHYFESNVGLGRGSVIFDIDCLAILFSYTACRECLSIGTIVIEEDESKCMGNALCFNLHCTNCGFTSLDQYSSPKSGRSFDINRKYVYALRQIGCGHSEGTKLNYLLDLPSPPSPNAYYENIKAIS